MKNLDSQPDGHYVSGALRRFGEELHEDPLFAYRSLVDRAHNACLRRATVASNYSPALLVVTQTIGGVEHVSICDNGEALAPTEIRQLYAAIRTGRAGAVARALVASGVDGADSLIGRLGVALLAAFLIADQIAISTRSYNAPPDAGVRYLCNSRSYLAEPQRIARAGTIVQLRIREDRKELATIAAIRESLIEHTRSLRLPIHVGADPSPINPRG